MHTVHLISNGDFRDSANLLCWEKQEETLAATEAAFKQLGVETVRATPYKQDQQHGFINTQAEACRVMAGIDPDAGKAVECPQVLALEPVALPRHPFAFVALKKAAASNCRRHVRVAPGVGGPSGSKGAFGLVDRRCRRLDIDPAVGRQQFK